MANNMPARVVTPTPFGNGPASYRERRAVAARRAVEQGLLGHALRSHFDEECAKLDIATLAAASQAALAAELDVLNWGLGQIENSAAGAKLVTDRVEQLSRLNGKAIERRWG